MPDASTAVDWGGRDGEDSRVKRRGWKQLEKKASSMFRGALFWAAVGAFALGFLLARSCSGCAWGQRGGDSEGGQRRAGQRLVQSGLVAGACGGGRPWPVWIIGRMPIHLEPVRGGSSASGLPHTLSGSNYPPVSLSEEKVRDVFDLVESRGPPSQHRGAEPRTRPR